METGRFNEVVEATIQKSRDVLVKKAGEYATEDRLHNFKVAAALKGETPRQALAGMMAKHTVSIYDMCRDGKEYSEAQWDEKIGDHLNYLLLLKAITVEEQDVKVVQDSEEEVKQWPSAEESTNSWAREYYNISSTDLREYMVLKQILHMGYDLDLTQTNRLLHLETTIPSDRIRLLNESARELAPIIPLAKDQLGQPYFDKDLRA